MSDYPHTIENGNGEQLTFVRRTSDERGELLEVENHVGPGNGPPMHVHHFQEESLTVREGKIAWVEQGGSEQTAGPGETVTFAPGVSHRFWNGGDEPLVCTGYIRPPDNIEYFLTQIYESTARNGGKRPGAFDGAYLSQRYRDEFAITEIPGPVRKLVFPVVAAVGRLFGKHKRFADAPEPRRA
jgi:mannose-6-phosphate isomerase-like protein (cupin superfamily)